MSFVAYVPQKPQISLSDRFSETHDTNITIFSQKIKKVKNLRPSRHWILIFLAVGENQKVFHENIEEINSTKKIYFQLPLDKM